ncbi:BMC domain-containing protein [Alteribacter populi]|uniref:BMC domain-containing protein n=1 Tax=Alteribacter populi TaxID=2011011 RepID=UPI000BBB041F|nr:BMC domain-containing protein [Alteribacter populi]
MNTYALGLIETVGYTSAISAADAALKAADVELIALEKVIGAGGAISVTIHLSGDVAAVSSAVETGEKECNRVGKVISAHVIPHSHPEVGEKLLKNFSLPDVKNETQTSTKNKKLKEKPAGRKATSKKQEEKKATNNKEKDTPKTDDDQV